MRSLEVLALQLLIGVSRLPFRGIPASRLGRKLVVNWLASTRRIWGIAFGVGSIIAAVMQGRFDVFGPLPLIASAAVLIG
jgi:hypothetical protein